MQNTTTYQQVSHNPQAFKVMLIQSYCLGLIDPVTVRRLIIKHKLKNV